MYKLTASTSRMPAPSNAAQNFSRPQRLRSPASENSRRPRSPAMQTFDDPMTIGAPEVQKSQPIKYAGSSSRPVWEQHGSRRPTERTARSVSPMRSERPPAHIRAQTPPAPAPPAYTQHGFLCPPGEGDELQAALPRTPPRSPLYDEQTPPQETRGRGSERSGLRDGMVPGPLFYQHAARRTDPSKLSAHQRQHSQPPRTPELDATSLSAPNSPPTMPLPPTPPTIQKLATAAAGGKSAAAAAKMAKTSTPTVKSRKSTPSMHDYMTLEQLENLWKNEDMTGGLVEAPPIQAPRFTMEQIMKARAQMGEIGVHPALRTNYQEVN